uniref:Uncharacterized protein n=1 Tax=Ciona savignyi TaxID=51511 RepID=H2YX56_CIOSA
MSVNQSSYDANHVNTSLRRSSPPVMGDTEAYIQGMKSAFQTKMGGLSPRGRREALMQQKLALEREQIHLQQMLREQEEILRLRQSELKKRHNDYTNKLQSFNCTGANATPSETYDESTDVYSTMNDYPRTITPVLPKYSSKLNGSSYSMSEYDRSRNANHVRDRDHLSSFVSSKYSPHDESSSRMNRCSHTPVRSPLRPKSNTSFRNSLQHSMHDSQIHTDDSLSRSQATMNNISMLSELIDTVDLSPPSGHMSQYTRSQADRDDLLTSTTFDPEDSELLDDIFFIR